MGRPKNLGAFFDGLGGKGWRNVGKSKRQELENSTGFKVLFMYMIAGDLFTFSRSITKGL